MSMNSETAVKEALKILKAKSNCSWNKVFRNLSVGAKIKLLFETLRNIFRNDIGNWENKVWLSSTRNKVEQVGTCEKA